MILALGTLFVLFILFLVISKTAGNIDNALYKLEYMIRKECDIRLENLEFRYKIKTADKVFEEQFAANSRFVNISDDIKNAVDSNE